MSELQLWSPSIRSLSVSHASPTLHPIVGTDDAILLYQLNRFLTNESVTICDRLSKNLTFLHKHAFLNLRNHKITDATKKKCDPV